MITRAAADPYAHARQFSPGHIHPGRARPRSGRDAPTSRGRDHRLLERRDEIAHAEPRAAQIDQRVDHELPRPVVGDLPAAVDLDHRDVAGIAQMRGIGVHPEREHRIVLQNPDLVRRRRIAPIGEVLHRAPGLEVPDAAQLTDEDDRLPPRGRGCRGRRCRRPAPARRDNSSARADPIRIRGSRARAPSHGSGRTPRA